VEGSTLKSTPIDLNGLLRALSQDDSDQIVMGSIPYEIEIDADPDTRAAQLDYLQRMVRGSRSWQSRRIAARVLGQSDELGAVPALIFALSDPDHAVRRYARDGLRFISRKFDGYAMPDDPSIAEIEAAQQQWRAWYRTTNPKFVFVETDL
jgi:hypothetical protein